MYAPPQFPRSLINPSGNELPHGIDQPVRRAYPLDWTAQF